jgi:hypothetical protein
MLPSWWLGGAVASTVLIGAVYVGCMNLSQPDRRSELERLERLEADRDYLDRRQEAICSVAADVVAERLSLRQAAEALRLLNVNSPDHLRMHVEYQDGQTEEERYCRSVLGHVQAYLVVGDARGPAVLARLGAELDALAQGRLGPPPRISTPRRPAPPVPGSVARVAGTQE